MSCFEKTLPEYKTIRTKYASEVDGVVTPALPEFMTLNQNGFTLKNCIEGLTDRNLKRYAFSVFGKYPAEDYFAVKDEDGLIENNYYIEINDERYDALNIKLVQENEGFLFSLALHDDLQKNTLVIKNNDEFFVFNLFGDAANTVYIDQRIRELISEKSGNFEKLLFSTGEAIFSARFKDLFDKVPKSVHNAVLGHFSAARRREGVTPFFADGGLVKDVTPEKEKDIKVFELRIFDPVAYRVYFYEAADIVYLGLVEKKPSDKVQSNQIKTAASIIKQLVGRK
jgi:putative component of toxin-antitoxin plasmid stabilization module